MFPEEEIGMAIWSTESLYLSKEQELLVELLSPEMYNLAVTFFLKKERKKTLSAQYLLACPSLFSNDSNEASACIGRQCSNHSPRLYASF